MYLSFPRRAHRTLSLCLVAVLAILALSTSPASAADPPASLTIDATPTSIEAGGITTFKVVLTNTSGSPMMDVALRLTLNGSIDKVDARLVKDETGEIRTDKIRRLENTIDWTGDMKKDGVLAIGVRVTSALINDAGQPATIVLNGEAGPKGEPPVIETDESVAVTFPQPVDPNQIDFTQVIEYLDGNDLVVASGPEVVANQRVDLTLNLVNNSDKPVYSLLIDRLQMETTSAASLASGEPTCAFEVSRTGITQGRGSAVPLQALGEEKGRNAIAAFLVKTEPGETSKARIRGTIVGTPECGLIGEASAYMTAVSPGADIAVEAASVGETDEAAMQAIAAPKLAFIQSLLELNPKLGPAIQFLILLSDFGDAPDSTNHFPATSMEAYPGINADFPTVFDATTGTPPGPKHRNGRPLHLGSLVSPELVVDAGPRKNIDPPNDIADLDIRDDGIDPGTLSFQHCIATSIDVEVTLTQVAIDHFAKTDSSAFLNIWLDGNHDGDWEDTEPCDGLNAREHIVIDQIINPSSPGTIMLTIPTGNIPVPQGGENETMWLRATLSDEKSVKIDAAQTYGDGRGPATGLRWGETEDYLYVPGAAAAAPGGFGPDLSITATSNLQTDLADESVSAAGTRKIAGMNFLKLQIRNRGDRLSSSAILEIEMDPYRGIPPIISTAWTGCLTCTVASAEGSQIDMAAGLANNSLPFRESCEGSDCRLVVSLGDVRPSEGGSILLGWPNDDPENADVQFSTSVISPGDVNEGNNTSASTAIRLQQVPFITSPPPGTLGWTGCLTCTYAFKGFGNPNSTMTLSSTAFKSGSVNVATDEAGFWQTDVALNDGTHEVTLTDASASAADAESANFNIGMPPVILSVDSSLSWDPASFGVRKYGDAAVQSSAVSESDDSCGPWQFMDADGRADLNGWKIPIRPGSSHELGLDLICDGQAGATLNWIDVLSWDFKDDDGDGHYTAIVNTPELDGEVEVNLTVTCGENEATYSGFLIPIDPATVVNAETGTPLENVAVTLWQRNTNDAGPRLAPWEAQAFGQANPQLTDVEGQFSFLTPSGGYGLTAQIDGFQPFRFGPLRSQGVFVPGRTYAMMPVQSGGRTAEVRITEDGFDPPYLEIEPGTTVEWLNVSLDVATTFSETPEGIAAAATAKQWDSGLLPTGETARVTFVEEGSFTYVNAADSSSQGAIIVKTKEPVDNSVRVYLPTIIR